jgi:hypothetical protein
MALALARECFCSEDTIHLALARLEAENLIAVIWNGDDIREIVLTMIGEVMRQVEEDARRPAGRMSSWAAARWPAPRRTCPPAATARSGQNTAAAAPAAPPR